MILPGIIVALPVLYAIAAWLWNKKLVPRRQSRGVPTLPFSKMFGEYLGIGFKESTFSLLPKKVENPKLKSLLSLKTINWVLLVVTLAMLGIYANSIWTNAWIPFLVLILSVWVSANPLITERKSVLARMFSVAGTVFRYGRGADLTPWRFVKIKKWDKATPVEIHISIPPEYDSSSPTSRDGFERHFNGTVTDENSWVYEWQSAKGLIIARPISHLPTMAAYPGSRQFKWHQIPLGVGVNGPVFADLSMAPHMLITGVTGSGKSVLQRNLVFHCIQHNDTWRFLGVDVKRVELTPFKKYSQTVMGIGTNLEDGTEIVRYVKTIMEKRYEKMEELGINNFKDMPLGPNGKRNDYAIMLMIDEAYMFLAPTGVKSDEGKAADALHAEASGMLGEIARLGRAAGIHLVMATQRPDAKVIYGELKLNLPVRIAAGRLDSTASAMTLDSAAATFLPAIRGRGIVSVYGEAQQFQGYFAEAEWIDNWLKENPGVEPTIYPSGGLTQNEELPGDLGDLMDEGYNFDDGIAGGEVDGELHSSAEVMAKVEELLPMPEFTSEQEPDILSHLEETPAPTVVTPEQYQATPTSAPAQDAGTGATPDGLSPEEQALLDSFLGGDSTPQEATQASSQPDDPNLVPKMPPRPGASGLNLPKLPPKPSAFPGLPKPPTGS